MHIFLKIILYESHKHKIKKLNKDKFFDIHLN